MPRKRKSEITKEEQDNINTDIEKDLLQANAIIAKTLIRRGGSVEEVVEATGLSIEYVVNIKNSIKRRSRV